jgi:uncharacterized protein (TIGR03083 family)
MATDSFQVIRRERARLADDIEGLSDEQWESRSLCTDWTVRDVVAHMTATARTTPAAFFAKLLSSGMSFAKMQARDIQVERGSSPADTLARFKAQVGSTSHPPGPSQSWLGETIAHAEDIRHPLGIPHDYPTAALVDLANFYRRSNLLIGGKRRVAGLRLRATDADWSAGSGPEVSGPILALVMATVGRKAYLDELAGEGLASLRRRG